VLTGVASLVPIVVGKVVSLPVVGYPAFSAVGAGGRGLPSVGAALVVYFLVLDILPQTFLQPYVTGHHLNTLVLLFAYVLGPIFFGWYGFFLVPIVFVLSIEAVRIVFPELLHGESVDPAADVAQQRVRRPRPSTRTPPTARPTPRPRTEETPRRTDRPWHSHTDWSAETRFRRSVADG